MATPFPVSVQSKISTNFCHKTLTQPVWTWQIRRRNFPGGALTLMVPVCTKKMVSLQNFSVFHKNKRIPKDSLMLANFEEEDGM